MLLPVKGITILRISTRWKWHFDIMLQDQIVIYGQTNHRARNHCFYHFTIALNLHLINPLGANFTKWSNILKQFADESFECMFGHFVGLALKGLRTNVLIVILLPLNMIVEECSESISINLMNISEIINPLSANPTKWSNILKQFLG